MINVFHSEIDDQYCQACIINIEKKYMEAKSKQETNIMTQKVVEF